MPRLRLWLCKKGEKLLKIICLEFFCIVESEYERLMNGFLARSIATYNNILCSYLIGLAKNLAT